MVMKRLRPFLVALVALAAVGVTVSVVLGVWTGTQTASGTVNATTASPDLYLCEPEGTGVGCGPDDSGPDEIIFEGLEDLLPSSAAASTLRLRNVGTGPMDLLAAVPAVTETADPGNDCDLTPDVVIGVLGQVPHGFFEQINDNHQPFSPLAVGLQLFLRGLEDPNYVGVGFEVAVHIAAGDYEDFLIQVFLPVTAPDACEDNVWDVAINWDVVSVGHGP
jgi:hypothetical protein